MPADKVGNMRNDMYLASEAIRFLAKDKEADLSAQDVATFNAYKASLDNATKFIPWWVKVVVAIALGLGTMVGWKRIVVTVGSKIGKTHLTYAQGGLRGNHGGCHNRRRGRLRPAGIDHPRALVGHCRHDGGQRVRTAMGDCAQHRHGMGADIARRHGALRHSVLHLLAPVLNRR